MEDKIKIVEYCGARVLTTQQLAEAYETNTDTITKNFNRNKDRYVEGKHYVCLKGENLKDFRANGQIDLLPNIHTLYLWTEKGTFLHAKSLNTDKAWEVYDRLVEDYFQSRERKFAIQELPPEMQMFKQLWDMQANTFLEQKRQAEKIEKLENELKLVEYNLNKGDQLEEIVQHTFKNIEGITSVADMTNEQLKQIIQKIEVDKEGNVDIYLRIFGDLGLDDSVLISYDHT